MGSLKIILVTAAVVGFFAAGVPNPPKASAQSVPDLTTATPLPLLDLTGMRLWDYAKPWHASEWNHAASPIPWRYNRVSILPDGKVNFVLDATGAPQLQGVNGMVAQTKGKWEVDVTLPLLRDGLVVAPLWIYNENSRDEIDFEFAGRKGLDVTMHVYPGGVYRKSTKRLFAGQDLSGMRMRLAIDLDVGAGTARMLVNGQEVHRFSRSVSGFFLTTAMRPRIEMWAANPNNADFVNWVGKWQPLAPGRTLRMTINGYKFTPR